MISPIVLELLKEFGHLVSDQGRGQKQLLRAKTVAWDLYKEDQRRACREWTESEERDLVILLIACQRWPDLIACALLTKGKGALLTGNNKTPSNSEHEAPSIRDRFKAVLDGKYHWEDEIDKMNKLLNGMKVDTVNELHPYLLNLSPSTCAQVQKRMFEPRDCEGSILNNFASGQLFTLVPISDAQQQGPSDLFQTQSHN